MSQVSELEIFKQVTSYLSEESYTFFVHIPEAHTDHYKSILQRYDRHNITIDGLYPDILGRTPAGHVFAVEVKGSRDIEKGIKQAKRYEDGAHYNYLAAPAKSLERVEESMAEIGTIRVKQAMTPILRDPPSVQIKNSLLDVETRLKAFLQGTVRNGSISSMQLSQPLNYISPLLVVSKFSVTDKEEICDIIATKFGFDEGAAAIDGAVELSLLNQTDLTLSDRGQVAIDFFRGHGVQSLSDLDRIKGGIPQRGSLFEENSTIGTFLQDVFRRHPDFELLYQAIQSFNRQSVTVPDVIERLVTQYPNVFLSLFCLPEQRSTAVEYLEVGDESEIYQNESVWKELIRQNIIQNFTLQLKHLGVIMPRTKVHSSTLSSFDPTSYPWYLRHDHGFW
ncbi:hypothetical protein [Haloarchaeobius amylolyticus]|uniref:hypothetical protein n=1 Tax=Haloarchaeobius amylolyticus TaxID=1198296 RepID=UPI002271E56A|nr:hypothetical protein [Haloarchaeobius amylolyticus]